MLPSADFAVFTNNTDATSVVLQAHFLAVEVLLRPWLLSQFADRVEDGRRNGLMALPASATLSPPGPPEELVKWPLKILRKSAEEFRVAK
jgi:hypothetical protein